MKEKPFVMLCDCGCENGFSVRYLGGILYISFLSGDWYTHQSDYNFRMIRKILSNNQIIKEIITDIDSLIELRDYLKSFDLSDKKVKNSSHIAVFCDSVYDSNAICLVSDFDYKLPLSLLKIRNMHHLFEIKLNNKLRNNLVKKIDNAIKSGKKGEK